MARTIPPEVAHHRARAANAARRGDIQAVEAARRDLKAARLEDYIKRAVDTAPHLTPAQCHRLLALLLRGGGDADAA